MKIKFTALLIVLIVISGCATTENYENILATWIGNSESQLVSKWGPPKTVYQESSNSKIFTYSRDRNVQLGGYQVSTPVTTRTNGNIYGDVNASYNSTSTTYVQSTTPIQNISMNCTTRFTITNGYVKYWSWEGNDCKAMAPK